MELLGRRLGVELPAQQLLRDVGVAVVGGLGDAAEEPAQRLRALGRRLLRRRHPGEGGATADPAPPEATSTAAAWGQTAPDREHRAFSRVYLGWDGLFSEQAMRN